MDEPTISGLTYGATFLFDVVVNSIASIFVGVVLAAIMFWPTNNHLTLTFQRGFFTIAWIVCMVVIWDFF